MAYSAWPHLVFRNQEKQSEWTFVSCSCEWRGEKIHHKISHTPWLKIFSLSLKKKKRPARELALEGVWDLHLLISRPKVYPIVALRHPEGRSKPVWSTGCYITPGLLSHCGASCYGAGNRDEREYRTLTRSCLRMQLSWVSLARI